jgi:hypothetical protein
MRASRVDRERVIDALKTAFVHDRLTKDELDARVGQALAARTYADLDALTVGIPAGHDPARLPIPPFQPYPPVRAAIKGSALAIATTALAASIFAGVMGHDPAAAAIVVVAFTVCTLIAGLLALVIAGVVRLASHLGKPRW